MTQGKALEYSLVMALAVLGTDNSAEVCLGFLHSGHPLGGAMVEHKLLSKAQGRQHVGMLQGGKYLRPLAYRMVEERRSLA
jgi:hypothetical protein